MIHNKVAVVGAGITGLTAAYQLEKKGVKIDLFERKAEPGGAIKSVKKNGWQLEYGPNTILVKDRSVSDFFEEIGLAEKKVTANPDAVRRYIVKDGDLVSLPDSIVGAFKTELFSLKGKMRVLAEPFISKKDGSGDESVAAFVERRLGSEVLDYTINPFVAGIFANRPEDLSLRHAFPVMNQMEQDYGSLVWAAFAGSGKRKKSGRIPRELISFQDGVQELPIAIASKLGNCLLNHDVKTVKKKGDGWYVLSQMGNFGPYDSVIVNIPLYKWTEELLPADMELFRTVKAKVDYPPLSVMLLGYRKEDVRHDLDGFGFLVPEKEKRKILGALFSSTLFKNRAPHNHHLITVFIGGGRQPELAELESDKLLETVQNELHSLIGVTGEPVFKDHVFWPCSIPKYHPGYDEILQALDEIEAANEGLYIAGNFRYGISVPDCIMSGFTLAESVFEDLKIP